MKLIKLSYLASLGCALLLATSACTKDDGPSIDDFPLNYEIPEINAPEGLKVGAYYANMGSQGMDLTRYNRVVGEWDPEGPDYQLCPHVRPVLGRYNHNINNAETCRTIQQHINWAKEEGGIDFFVFPSLQFDKNNQSINSGSMAFMEFVMGNAEESVGHIDWKGMKLCVSMNMNDFNDSYNAEKHIDDDIDEEGFSAKCDVLYRFVIDIVNSYMLDDNQNPHPLYMTVDGKPMLVIYQAFRIFSTDSRRFYDNLRKRVKEATNVDLYLVVNQGAFTPPARYHNFYLTGGVDAVTMDCMYNQFDWFRRNNYPQFIDQNYKYNREFDLANYGVDFIPSVPTSYNAWIYNGNNYNIPIEMRDRDKFRTMCNVAKNNLGNSKIVLIDAFNDWNYDKAIEPTDPYYGNGYGLDYLHIVNEEFKQ